jgi:hypothetical protein
MRDTLSVKLLNSRMKRVHTRSIADACRTERPWGGNKSCSIRLLTLGLAHSPLLPPRPDSTSIFEEAPVPPWGFFYIHDKKFIFAGLFRAIGLLSGVT